MIPDESISLDIAALGGAVQPNPPRWTNHIACEVHRSNPTGAVHVATIDLAVVACRAGCNRFNLAHAAPSPNMDDPVRLVMFHRCLAQMPVAADSVAPPAASPPSSGFQERLTCARRGCFLECPCQ